MGKPHRSCSSWASISLLTRTPITHSVNTTKTPEAVLDDTPQCCAAAQLTGCPENTTPQCYTNTSGIQLPELEEYNSFLFWPVKVSINMCSIYPSAIIVCEECMVLSLTYPVGPLGKRNRVAHVHVIVFISGSAGLSEHVGHKLALGEQSLEHKNRWEHARSKGDYNVDDR